MSYVPHTATERQAMLDRIGVETVEELFDVIPEAQRFPSVDLPAPASEMDIMRELRSLSEANASLDHSPSFLGAGAYHHFSPAVVDHVISRAEFYSAYTPYQPEISQGTLQTLFEYQTMICDLTGMEVSNASHYDGATAVAEAVIMAHNVARGRRHKAILAPSVHPEYRATTATYLQGMDVELLGGNDPALGLADLVGMVDDDTSCLVVQSPDFFGRIVDLTGVADQVHARGAMLVVVCDPISLGLLEPPGAFGADIVVGEGQPLGSPAAFGGPYLGFFTCRQRDVRRMSGRLVGETVDADGKRGYVLTLSTREQHIRRERATSNICTNQGLVVLAAGVYLAAMGKAGLAQVARLCYHKAHYAAAQVDALAGYAVDLATPYLKEFVVDCPRPAAEINQALYARHGIIGGYDLSRAYAGMERKLLLCVTEMNSADEIDALVAALWEVAQ